MEQQANSSIDPSATVDQTIARYPQTIAVFNRFGLDSCCGGGAPVREAARRDGVDPVALLAALRDATAERKTETSERNTPDEDCGALPTACKTGSHHPHREKKSW